MRVIFELGDKFYKKDYTPEDYYNFQFNVMEFCKLRHWKLQTKFDRELGQYVEIVADCVTKAQELSGLQIDKLLELKDVFESVVSSPIFISGTAFDCSDVALLKLLSLQVGFKDENRKFTIIDAYEQKIEDVDSVTIEKVIVLYGERYLRLLNKYIELKKIITSSTDSEELKDLDVGILYDID